jgi:hypothetical protein
MCSLWQNYILYYSKIEISISSLHIHQTLNSKIKDNNNNNNNNNNHKQQGLDPLIRSVSRVAAALANVS